MKYYPPIGSSDPNAPYVDDNPAAGQEGSAVPAKAIEHPQREIVTVLTSVGLEPNENSVSQLNEAIDLKIDLATGGGENPLNDLLDLLRARLRIFPEILTANGTFNLSQPTGSSVRIPSGIDILHRGVFTLTTAQQDFSHVANKTYHLRYRFTGTPGWELVDTANSSYNPGGLPEGNVAFDTGYDDMVSHRIVTDASNVATITPLVNKHDLALQVMIAATNGTNLNTDSSMFDLAHAFNWARRPSSQSLTLAFRNNNGNISDLDFCYRPAGATLSELLAGPPVLDVDRYRISQKILCDYTTNLTMHFSARA